jgi:hypothetical protein
MGRQRLVGRFAVFFAVTLISYMLDGAALNAAVDVADQSGAIVPSCDGFDELIRSLSDDQRAELDELVGGVRWNPPNEVPEIVTRFMNRERDESFDRSLLGGEHPVPLEAPSELIAEPAEPVCDLPRVSPLRIAEAAGDPVQRLQNNPQYQSEHVFPDGFSDGLAMGYDVYLEEEQSNETNQCDDGSVPTDNLCVWFAAGQANTNGNCQIHIGPIRGADHGGQWNVNFGHYCNGNPTTQSSVVDLPTQTWHSFLIFRTSTDILFGAPISSWDIYHDTTYLGTSIMIGTTLNYAAQWMELIEHKPCDTDFVKVRYDNLAYWSNLAGPPLMLSNGLANYESRCGNTSWEQISGNYVFDKRQTPRVIAQGDPVWTCPK